MDQYKQITANVETTNSGGVSYRSY